MVKLANDPELSRKMGAVGRQKIEKEYDWDRKVDKIRQIYSEAVASFAYRQGEVNKKVKDALNYSGMQNGLSAMPCENWCGENGMGRTDAEEFC